jgi:hypothetical protein
MIKKRYLAEKVAEQEETGTFHERREYKPFWRKRIGSVDRWKLKSSYKFGRLNDEAVFLCGSYTFRADILNITLDETPAGIEEVVPGDLCYNIECKFLQEELEGLAIFLS